MMVAVRVRFRGIEGGGYGKSETVGVGVRAGADNDHSG